MASHYRLLLCCLLVVYSGTWAMPQFLEAMQDSIAQTNDVLEVSLPPPEMIRRQGYPAEEHTATTEDGYILTMHRIPHGRKSPAAADRPVVFLQHGLLCSSADWVMGIPEKSLGFILADKGYDVWMGNARGNTYSKTHAIYTSSDKEFWDFSWHEMGKYDIPAEIDYILETTGQKKLHYVAHSMGTTMFFVMCSLKPEYNSKVHLMAGLGPVATVSHIRSPIRLLAAFVNHIDWITSMMGVYEFLPNTGLMEYLADKLCGGDVTSFICTNILFTVAGYNQGQLNMTMLPVIMGHTPAGASTKTLMHFAQEVNSEKFCQYDLGKAGNLEQYGQDTPPEYDLGKVTVPVVIYWGQNDWLATPQDVYTLAPMLQNLVGKFRVNMDEFNHLDFLWAIDADKLLYAYLTDMLENF